MTEKNSPGWWRLWLGRVVVHAVLGALTGAVFGALSVALAGLLIAVVQKGNESVVEVAFFLGLIFGAIAGSVSVLVSWSVLGAVAPPTRALYPSRFILNLTELSLFCGAMSGVAGYASWCLWCSWHESVLFMSEFANRSMEAAFGVSAWMMVTHLAAMILMSGRAKSGRNRSNPKPVGE